MSPNVLFQVTNNRVKLWKTVLLYDQLSKSQLQSARFNFLQLCSSKHVLSQVRVSTHCFLFFVSFKFLVFTVLSSNSP